MGVTQLVVAPEVPLAAHALDPVGVHDPVDVVVAEAHHAVLGQRSEERAEVGRGRQLDVDRAVHLLQLAPSQAAQPLPCVAVHADRLDRDLERRQLVGGQAGVGQEGVAVADDVAHLAGVAVLDLGGLDHCAERLQVALVALERLPERVVVRVVAVAVHPRADLLDREGDARVEQLREQVEEAFVLPDGHGRSLRGGGRGRRLRPARLGLARGIDPACFSAGTVRSAIVRHPSEDLFG